MLEECKGPFVVSLGEHDLAEQVEGNAFALPVLRPLERGSALLTERAGSLEVALRELPPGKPLQADRDAACIAQPSVLGEALLVQAVALLEPPDDERRPTQGPKSGSSELAGQIAGPGEQGVQPMLAASCAPWPIQ